MERQAVNSSNLCSVGYNEKTKTLEIEFKSGRTYQYFEVPIGIYRGLLSARSCGRYFSAIIKNQYEMEEL